MLSEPLVKVVKAARLNGYIFLTFGGIATVAFLVVLSLSSDRPGLLLLTAGVVALVELVQAALLFYFANRLEARRVWAGVALMILTAVIFANVFIGLIFRQVESAGRNDGGGFICGAIGALIGALPSVYLAACCLNAVPELRHMRRARLRERAYQTHGFEVIPKGEPPKTPPNMRIPPRPGQPRTPR